jgi:hypothetical protein
MVVHDVWFWAPFHMLQAYPMVRNLPLPDVMIPLAHLMWVPLYIAEHWTGLCEPVEEAWAMKSYLTPIQGILLLSFFYFTHKLSDTPIVVKIGAVFYFAFMLFAKNIPGYDGSPKKTYDEQITASADPSWNNQHVFLHVYYLVILWTVALTVPYKKLAARTEGPSNTVSRSLPESDPSNTASPGASLFEVLKEAIDGAKLLPEPSTLSKTSRFLILQGVIYASTGLLIFLAPGVFNKIMFFPEAFSDEETPLYRTIGFCVIGIGYFYIEASRMNNNFWAVATIFTRMTMTPVLCMTLWLVYGGPPQLCVTFSLLDPTLAFLTYLTLKQEGKMQYTALS